MLSKIAPRTGIKCRFPAGVESGRMFLKAEATSKELLWRLLDGDERELLRGSGYAVVGVGTVVRPTLPFYVELHNESDEEMIVSWRVQEGWE